MSRQRVGRYVMGEAIAAGGMAQVHLGRLSGPAGFGRTVAMKRLHAHLEEDPEFLTMLLDEARIASRVYHRNVVQTLDVVTEGGVTLVLEYVHGESLARLIRNARAAGEELEPTVAVAIVAGVLRGLHAAHDTVDERGRPLDIVHRDVSPHNVLVDLEGVPRLLDFGIAKAEGRLATTQDGRLKGKLAYMAPEQLRGEPLDRRTDVYAASIVLWELLAGRRLFDAADEGALVGCVLHGASAGPRSVRPGLSVSLDEIVMRGLALAREERFPSAGAMADALEAAAPVAAPGRVGAWVARSWSGQDARRALLAGLELAEVPRTEVDVEADAGGTVSAIAVASPIAAPAPVEPAAVEAAPAGPSDLAAPPPPRRSRARLAGLLALALFAAGGAGVALASRARARPPVALSPPPASAPSASASASESVPSASAPEVVVASTPPAASPAASARVGARAPTGLATAPASRPVSRTTKRPSCEPPWTLDEQGNHVWKRECFKP